MPVDAEAAQAKVYQRALDSPNESLIVRKINDLSQVGLVGLHGSGSKPAPDMARVFSLRDGINREATEEYASKVETLKRKLGEDDPAGFLFNSFCAGDKESRNKGVERAFLDWAVEHAKSAGVTTFADLMERKSGAGSSLWTDHGFKECGDPIVVGGGKFKTCPMGYKP